MGFVAGLRGKSPTTYPISPGVGSENSEPPVQVFIDPSNSWNPSQVWTPASTQTGTPGTGNASDNNPGTNAAPLLSWNGFVAKFGYYGVTWMVNSQIIFLSDEPNQVVLSASNTTPIVVGVATTYGFNNGESVTVSNVTGNTNANGLFTIAGITPTSFQLVGSAGNGAYAGGGTVQINGDQVRLEMADTNNCSLNIIGTPKILLAGAVISATYSRQGAFPTFPNYVNGVPDNIVATVGGISISFEPYLNMLVQDVTQGGALAWVEGLDGGVVGGNGTGSAGPTVTLTGAAGVAQIAVGQNIVVIDATHGVNSGTFLVTAVNYVSGGVSIQWANAAAVSSTTVGWTIPTVAALSPPMTAVVAGDVSTTLYHNGGVGQRSPTQLSPVPPVTSVGGQPVAGVLGNWVTLAPGDTINILQPCKVNLWIAQQDASSNAAPGVNSGIIIQNIWAPFGGTLLLEGVFLQQCRIDSALGGNLYARTFNLNNNVTSQTQYNSRFYGGVMYGIGPTTGGLSPYGLTIDGDCIIGQVRTKLNQTLLGSVYVGQDIGSSTFEQVGANFFLESSNGGNSISYGQALLWGPGAISMASGSPFFISNAAITTYATGINGAQVTASNSILLTNASPILLDAVNGAGATQFAKSVGGTYVSYSSGVITPAVLDALTPAGNTPKTAGILNLDTGTRIAFNGARSPSS